MRLAFVEKFRSCAGNDFGVAVQNKILILGNMKEALVVRYHRHGDPAAVLTAEHEPLMEVRAGQVLIRLRRAVIHPSDAGMIAGSYGRLRALPAVAGREGVGEIAAVGAGVKGLKIGQRVRMPEEQGTWRTHVVVEANEVLPVPDGLSLEMASMAFINPPTAWCLLHQFVRLEAGDWVVQNAGTSAVAGCVIQLAHHFGIKTLSVVREASHEASLKALGADKVVVEGSGWEKSVSVRAKLALNSIGGPSVIALTKVLEDGAPLVTFGGMSSEPIRFPTRYLIFNDIQYRGFWMDRWVRMHSKGELQKMMDKVFELIHGGVLKIAVEATYPIERFQEAFAHAMRNGRKGKILLSFDGE